MYKTIALTHPRHKPPQALARVKNELRKYFKRERRKELPEGSDYWHFDCRLGLTEEAAESVKPSELIRKLDGLASEGALSVYVEILARPAVKAPRQVSGSAETGSAS